MGLGSTLCQAGCTLGVPLVVGNKVTQGQLEAILSDDGPVLLKRFDSLVALFVIKH